MQRFWDLHFNSIKVQLELCSLSGGCSLVSRFQFHKGTIRTSLIAFSSVQSVLFQFHKGTIRTYCIVLLYSFFINFNSIKVQLEQFLRFCSNPLLCYFNSIKVQLERCFNSWKGLRCEFQFHKGTIRTILG